MPNEPVYFAPVHNLLRYRPRMTGLAVTVAYEDNILTVSNAAGEAVQCRYQDNNPAAMVHKMLAHYPTEATVNGEEVQRFPFPDEAQMTCERPGRRVLAQRGYAGSRHLDDTPKESKILVEGLAYRYRPPNADTVGSDLHRNTAVIMPEPEGRKPHYWQARVYRARPNYRWKPDTVSQRDECQFNLNNWQHPEFVPSAAVWMQLQDTAQRQLDKAAAKIRADAGIASVEWKQPPISMRDRASYIAWHPCLMDTSIEPDVGSKVVQMAGQEKMNTAVSYSIALALYDQNCAGLVPVEGPRAGQSFRELPILRCEKVVITKPDGSQVVHNPTAEAELGHAYTAELAPYRINAKSIIAHLAVTGPDGAESKYQAPLEIYMHGDRYEENIWLTDRQADTELSELAELIYDAYWDWHGDNSEAEAEQYFADCKILKTRILEGDETAFVAELQQLCDRFWPQSLTQEETVTVSNSQHSLTWRKIAKSDP